MRKIPVGILGATGVVGQHYLKLLSSHPWFEISFLAASERSAGKSYKEAVEKKWRMQIPIPEKIGKMSVHPVDQIQQAHHHCQFVFSALNRETAQHYEESYASAGLPVLSNASYHRSTSDVPILIPEVNPEHMDLILSQQHNRGWKKGFIAVKPNCSLQSFMIPLTPLHRRYKIKKLLVTTMQAVSGAGYPGVSSLDITDNIIPFIKDEEEKTETESLKIWGTLKDGKIDSAHDLSISAHCNRVPVLDGHMACVSVSFEGKPNKEEILELWSTFQAIPQHLQLPSAPSRPILYLPEADRPQPRLDRHHENGMSIAVGRLRPCPVLDFRFVALSHNVIRGAAGGGILNAELLHAHNFL